MVTSADVRTSRSDPIYQLIQHCEEVKRKSCKQDEVLHYPPKHIFPIYIFPTMSANSKGKAVARLAKEVKVRCPCTRTDPVCLCTRSAAEQRLAKNM